MPINKIKKRTKKFDAIFWKYGVYVKGEHFDYVEIPAKTLDLFLNDVNRFVRQQRLEEVRNYKKRIEEEQV